MYKLKVVTLKQARLVVVGEKIHLYHKICILSDSMEIEDFFQANF